VSTAESKTIVEQDAAIGDGSALERLQKTFRRNFSQREIKCGVRLEMLAGDHGVSLVKPEA